MLFLYLTATEAADLLQKLSLDSQKKTLEIPEPKKKVPLVFLFNVCLGQLVYSS